MSGALGMFESVVGAISPGGCVLPHAVSVPTTEKANRATSRAGAETRSLGRMGPYGRAKVPSHQVCSAGIVRWRQTFGAGAEMDRDAGIINRPRIVMHRHAPRGGRR